MLILVPWRPFIFGWLLLTGMILAGYAVYCIQEDRNPFSVEKYHLQQVHSHHGAGLGSSEQKRSRVKVQRSRQDRGAASLGFGCASPAIAFRDQQEHSD